MLHSHINMDSGSIRSTFKGAMPFRLAFLLCIFLLGQVIAGGHFHQSEHESSTAADCAVCMHAAHSDDVDIPDILGTQSLAFVDMWQAEVAGSQPSENILEENARAPPYS